MPLHKLWPTDTPRMSTTMAHIMLANVHMNAEHRPNTVKWLNSHDGSSMTGRLVKKTPKETYAWKTIG
eukprot:CAMPEP_0172784360 /NCGR_PEP_ID=MMETSP1074-20121228/204904_1 /TAXON_ID=2916 /ORGANISM="Ceratium fusus, Strain PA161109" /LENGTH=67 /DNA_ID=CAMNT_0013621363 /DNA_START=657 /DNA_END=860 /DNA_ORIENTATION=-